MSSKKKRVEAKPIEQWNAEDWETAYNILNKKYQHLRDCMRKAMQNLNVAI